MQVRASSPSWPSNNLLQAPTPCNQAAERLSNKLLRRLCGSLGNGEKLAASGLVFEQLGRKDSLQRCDTAWAELAPG